jgi:FAD/FMN-containing dehydrogenase
LEGGSAISLGASAGAATTFARWKSSPRGRLVRASEAEHPDLFWGLRGGGGNFGVVTSFEYQLHAVGPDVIAGAIAWRAEEAPRVLEMYRALAADAPSELAVVALMRPAPPAPWLAKEIHGKPIVVLFACHSGSVAEGERLVAPIKGFGMPVGDVLQRRTYVSQRSLIDATQPKGRRYYWKSEYVPRPTSDLLTSVIDHAGRIVSPHSGIVVFPLDGALNRLPEAYSPAGNRDAGAVLNITASWEKAADDTANIEWARAAWREMRRFSTGGTYVNFLTEEEVGERVHAAYGAHYERLVETKTTWDPGNLFRTNKNIPPRVPSPGLH